MPRKRARQSTTLDDLIKLDLSLIRRDGGLVDAHSGAITWRKYGKVYASVRLQTSLRPSEPDGSCILISYSTDSGPKESRITLVQIPSNLGRGGQWYFVCPTLGVRCRTLYAWRGLFISRKAIPGILYRSQAESPSAIRSMGKLMKVALTFEDMRYNWLDKPYTKTHYRNKPTPMVRKFTRCIRTIRACADQEQQRINKLISGLI